LGGWRGLPLLVSRYFTPVYNVCVYLTATHRRAHAAKLHGLRLMETDLRRVDACLGSGGVGGGGCLGVNGEGARKRGKGVEGGERLGQLPNSLLIYT
jgi:hypothetical protein